MIKQVSHIFLFIYGCSITAQTLIPETQIVQPVAPKDTVSITTPATTQTIEPTAKPLPTQAEVATGIVKANQKKKIRKPRLKPDFPAENKEITKLYCDAFDRKKEIILQNKRYRIYNNYVTGGAGKCYNSGWKEWQLCPALDFNFHIEKKYFQVGGMLVGPRLGVNNCLQTHICWGYRFDRVNYMLAAYGGLSYTGGYYVHKDSVDQTAFRAIGGYVALQYFYKINIDYGIGAIAFLDVNTTQILSGIRLELFFSGAYRGLKRHDLNTSHEIEKE